MEKTQMPVAREEKILVLVRLRPLNQKEIAANEAADWECINDTTILYRNTLREGSNFPSAYSFDKVYRGECPTRQVYEDGTKEIALSVVKGINCSIFAYGQTSSGKTYTMTGITEFAVADIFDYIFQHEERAFSVKFSAIEIYNEAIRDLLSSDGTSLRLRDDPEKGTVVEKATEETLRDWNHLKELLSICEGKTQKTCFLKSKLTCFYIFAAQRKIGETSLNERSSRSHQMIRLNFIDLAGSERASQAMSAGTRLKEGCHINRSLLTLGTVIRKLSKGRQGHINFRDSKLTRILQPCLGGNARTAIICTLSPARSHVELTKNTLLFACCAKEVTTKARINVVMSDKALLKQLQRELARLETELRNPASSPASNCDCAMTVRKKDLQIQKMEKEIAELRKQRDLAQSRLEDFMRMIEHNVASKPGTPHFGNHTDKWEDGSVSETSGVVDSDRRSFISDGMSTPLSISRAYVHSHSDDDDLDEDLPRRSEDLSEEYCREVQCIETEESVTVYNNKKDKRAEPENVLGCGEDANGETSVSQNVRVRSWNRRETVSGPSTPPENIGTGFLGRPESHKIAFPDLEFGSTVSRNDSMSSCGSDSTGTQSIRTPLGEEGGITSIRTFVEGLKEMAKRQGEVSNAEDSGKMRRDIGLDSMDREFERQRQEILELWQTCNISLVHRTYFYLLFKGDEADSIYIGVELRRLLFMKDSFSQGNQALEGGETLTLASSRKELHRERKMLSKLVGKRFSGEERKRIYHKFGIAINSKRRRLQLVNELWSNPKDMTQVMESADVVAKLVRFAEQGRAMKEMFGLTFTPPSFLTTRRSHSWRKSMPALF
ncbi:kinesin like protein [Arabidopsis thaliana]|nr:kinesin like protein [Arabidopsis thaliana]CAB80558.1 kinesin like protein [Arabidopsis thaliana]